MKNHALGQEEFRALRDEDDDEKDDERDSRDDRSPHTMQNKAGIFNGCDDIRIL
jgi:hypothetical protein